MALVTFVAFLPALRNGFVTWDDQSNFLENTHYRGLGLANLRWMWTTFLLGHYVPLTWMTLGLDYVIWGMNPAGYHLTSMLIHSGNAVLTYFIARRLLQLGAGQTIATTALRIAAAFAALAFAVHPLRVESVAWATERRDVVSAFFYLGAILCYLRHSEYEDGFGRWYWLAVGAFVCALLSKGTAVTLPAVLLVLGVYPLRRIGADFQSPRTRRAAIELLPFVALSVVFVVITFVALQSMPQLTIPRKIAVSAYSLGFYLWKTAFPTGLAPLYDLPPDIDPLGALYVACYVLFAGVTAAAWVARKKRPAILTAWILFVLIMLPLLGVHQNGPQIAADRYTYNAAPVICILLAAGWLSLRRPLSTATILSASLVIALLGALTWKQTGIWRDSSTMWSTVLRKNDRSSIALTAMGNLEARAGRSESAVTFYRRSLDIDPLSGEAENNLGIALSQLGKLEEAGGHFERAIRLKPDYYEAENNLGLVIAELGGAPDTAIAHYREALRVNPDYADAHINWGSALVTQGKFDEAISHFERALAIRPDDADAHRNWGVALARQQKFGEAIVHFQRALDLRPGFTDVERLLRQAEALQRGRGGAPSRP